MRPLFALVLALALALPVVAQQAPERLPELTPREFEIRGDLEVSLPDLQRQPLRGFTPPPRTYIVPADRRPFVGPYAQRVEDLPEDPLAAPATPSIVRSQPRTGQVDLLAGRYLARQGRLSLNAAGFGLDASYRGFSDYEPAAASGGLPDATRPRIGADDFEGSVGYSAGHALRLRVGLDGAYHQYGLLAYDPTPDLYDPKRTLRTYGGELSLSGDGSRSAPFSTLFRYERSDLSDEVNSPLGTGLQDAPLELSEQRAALAGRVTAGPAHIDASAALSGLGDAGFGGSLGSYSAGAGVDLDLGEARLRVGGRVLGFATSVANGDAHSLQIAPVLAFDTPLSPTLRFYARNEPRLGQRSLADLARQNPYVEAAPLLAPDVDVLASEFGVEVQGGAARLAVYGGYDYSPTRLYFERLPLSQSGLYAAHYDAATVARAGADVTLYGPGGISLSAGGAFRLARLPDQDRAIPLVSPLSARASLAVPFAGPRGLLQGALRFEGPRPTGVEGEDAPAWSELTLEGHYRFAGRFGALARAEHLLGRAEQWPGFPQPPAVLTLGVRAGW
jgi:hypothetical protein